MKTHARTKWMRTLGNISYMLGVAFLIAAMAVNAMPVPSAMAIETPMPTKTPAGTSTPTSPANTATPTTPANTSTPTTPANTATPTTPANTSTPTNTPTNTPTTTGEPGPSNTPTDTPTNTPTGTLTPTNTPTDTPTSTPTTTGEAGPSIETVLSAILLTLTEENPVQSVYDTATLSGVTSDAGGTVTYMVYSDGQCSIAFANAGTVNVTNGIVPNSNPVDFDTPGTYYWQASYSGDQNNDPVVDECAAEILVVETTTTTTEPGPTPPPLIPVTGANLSGGGTQTIFFNLGIAFLGLGLVLNGLARERKELDL